MSGWHHHGTRHLYAFLEAGRMRLEYGPKGALAVEVKRGDFFHIPPYLVHRDVNPDEEHELVVVNTLVGRGDPVVNVEGPRATLSEIMASKLTKKTKKKLVNLGKE